MSDRTNRVLLVLVSLVLIAMGGVGLSFSLGAWGQGAASAHVFTATLVRWWREGSWMSFAAASFTGLVFAVAGLVLAVYELGRRGGRPRLGDFDLLQATVPATDGQVRGRTTVRAAGLSRALQVDLSRLEGVDGARVDMFGRPGELEVLARLDVLDTADMAGVGAGVRSCLERLGATAGLPVARVDVVVTLVSGPPARRVA